MATCPLIKPLQTSGGTFFTFTSSAEDLSQTFNNSGNKFRFSKFVLLNIPKIATPAYLDNKIQFGAIDGALLEGLDPDHNINLAQSFQNYCLNLEAMIISRKTTPSTAGYDRSLKLNVAERSFWKWMKEIGAIRFKNANAAESTVSNRYTEEQEVLIGSSRYNKVVQYIGDIQIVNNVQNTDNAYSELYINVPTKDGNTPLVLFKSEQDVNYFPGLALINSPANPIDIEAIYGRSINDVHPAGLSINAFFDQDTLSAPVSMLYNTSTTAFDIPFNWYDPATGPNAYFLESAFNDVTNDRLQKVDGSTTVEYTRSRLDGIMVDFTPTDYKPIVDSPNISTIQEFNSTFLSGQFDFNAVLVYYDVFDAANPTDSATNLYGILFLEDVEPLGTEFGIPTFKKLKPNSITKLNGNSYGFKINIKFDTSIDNVGVEKAINDYNAFSMELFIDTLNILQNAASSLNNQSFEIIDLKNKITELEDLIFNQEDVTEITARIEYLEESLIANQALFSNSSDILGLISKNRDEISQLISGKTSIEISYNIDAVKPGLGINIDKSVANVIKVNNTVQAYNLNSSYASNLSAGGTIELVPFTNYYRHDASGAPLLLSSNIIINIDDTNIKWSKGQVFRLVFNDPLDLGTISSNNIISIYTDATNILSLGVFGKLIGVLTYDLFDVSNEMPIFDIVCVNPTTLEFVIDQIR